MEYQDRRRPQDPHHQLPHWQLGGGRHHGREEDQVAVQEDREEQAGGVAGGGGCQHHAGEGVLQGQAGGQHDG